MRNTILTTIAFCVGVTLYASCLLFVGVVSAAPRVQIADAGKQIVVDDFEDGFDGINNLDGEARCWAELGGTVDCQGVVQGSQGRLKMSYDVTSPDAYALYSSSAISLNVTDLDVVWVSLLGTEGGEQLYVELKDCGLHGPAQFPKEKVDDYLHTGILTASWGAAVVPLTEFEAITDLTCIGQVNVLAHQHISSGVGAVLLDNIQFLPEDVVIDDFEDQDEYNRLGGLTGYWSRPEDQTHITFSYPSGEIKLVYDVETTAGISESIYWTHLGNSSLLSRKDVLSFDIRGETGGEQVAVEFRDCGLGGERQIPKVKISDYLAGGITTKKQRVSIPLIAFGPDIDWNCVENLNVLVSSHPWFASDSGTVYVDNFKLSPADDLPPLWVDNFDDCNLWNAQLKRWGQDNNPPATISADAVAHGESGCAYRMNYSVTGDSSGWLISELDRLDVSEYTYLRFVISGAEGGEEPHFYLRDSKGKQRYFENVRPTKFAREVLIPLSYFGAAIDLTSLSEFKIAYEWKSMSGSVLIDEIGFVDKWKIYMPHMVKPIPVTPVDPPIALPCGDEIPSCSAPGPLEPNNHRCSATPLEFGQEAKSEICGIADGSDYYSVTLASASRINVRLSDIPKNADYDVYIYDGERDRFLDGSRRAKVKNESFGFTPKEPGTYYIRVYRVRGYSSEPYRLLVTEE